MEARLLDHLTSRINADLDLLVELRHLQPNGSILSVWTLGQADL